MASSAASLAQRPAPAARRPRPELRPVPPAEPAPPRDYGRLALLLLSLLVGGLVLDAGWRWLQAADLFPLERVTLDGHLQRVGEQELRAALEPHVDRGMLALNVKAIRAALEELPWVASASVRRAWPATLEVAIVEQVALARWNDEQLLNPGGELFRPAPATIDGELPALRGPVGSETRVLARFEALDAQLAPLGLAVRGLELDQRQAWRALLEGDVVMRLGAEQGETALRRFVRAYPRLAANAEQPLASVDLRYPNGFALAWGQPEAAKGTSQ